MEEKAVDCYFKLMQTQHQNFKVVENELFIKKDKPFIGASPDRLVCCDCCGEGVLECKAPFSVRHTTPVSRDSLQHLKYLVYKSKSPSSLTENDIVLNKSHPYFTQCQMQMAVTNKLYCDFFCWTSHGHFLES